MKIFGKLITLVIATAIASRAYATPSLAIDVDTAMAGLQTSRTVSAGSTFSVEIQINNVVGLFAYDIDVQHDATVLAANGVAEGAFLGTAGSTFFAGDASTNPVNAVATLLSVTTGASGSGALYAIQYTALAAGVSSLQFTFADFSDDQFNPITVNLSGASITVQGASLPSTLFMIGFGLVAIANLHRRNWRRTTSQALPSFARRVD